MEVLKIIENLFRRFDDLQKFFENVASLLFLHLFNNTKPTIKN